MKRGRESESGSGVVQKRVAQKEDMNPYKKQHAATSRLTTNDALSYLRDVKAKFADNKDTYDTFLEIMKKFKAQIITTEGVIEQVKSLFRGHRELILGFNTFLPKGYEITLPLDEEEPKAAVEFDQAINYVNKIKTRFSNDERVYKAFLEILNMYRKGQKTITNVYEEVANLFRNHNDLLEEFTYFLPDATPPALQSGPVRKITARARATAAANRAGQNGADPDYGRGMRGGSRATDMSRELQWVEKVKSKLKSKEGYQEFLKTLNLYAQDVITRPELVGMVQDLLSRHSDIAHGFDGFLSRLESADFDPEVGRGRLGNAREQRGKGSNADKYGLRPISDMDVSEWERSTTSYVKLPKGYPKLKASHVTPLGRSVLQDTWVSVTSGSEDYSFKHMRKNQYEEALFRCEDDRFELDMAIECSQSAVNALTRIVKEVATMDAEARERFRLERGKLLSIHFRMVQKIYGTGPGERGAEMVDMLKKNPAVAAEVVLGRLTQKVEEWQADKRKMTEVWQKMYDANYHKSLDHRSFYFKQTDKRNLAQKAMLQDIKDVAEKRRADDHNVYLSTTSFATRLAPDLTFQDNHSVVHDDVRKLIKYSMEDMLAANAAEGALDFWYTIVEPFFGLPPQKRDIKVESHEDSKVMKGTLSSIRLQAMKGENENDSAAPSVTDPGNQDDPASILEAMGEIASGRVDAAIKPEGGTTSEEGVAASELGDAEAASSPKVEVKKEGTPAGDSEKAYLNCKPLAPTDYVRKAHQPETPAMAGRVFYGNEHFYQFYRLHQHLYERLKTARKCALQVSSPSFRSKSEAEQEDAVSNMDEAAVEVHNKFMTLASDLIDGAHDSSTYEDACRLLLGTNSYTLFTLDKLIYKIVKHLQVILADEASMKLAELYKYEQSRGGKDGHVIEAVYYQNAHILLHEDPTFRFESHSDGRFTIQLLDTDRSEVPAGLLQPDFMGYLEQFTDTPATVGGLEVESRIRRPFLKRTMITPAQGDGPPEERELTIMNGTQMRNGLECKLTTSTSKVSYVLDTEDWFRRVKTCRRPGFNGKGRVQQFESWLKKASQAPHPLRNNSMQPPLVPSDAAMHTLMMG